MTTYVTPASVEAALALLDEHRGRARIIAGGTDLLPDMRSGKRTPACLVDITGIPGLREIRVAAGHVEVGACVTFAELRDHPFIRQHIHALAEAAASVGVAAIQNAATWAGNLVQAMPAADGAIVALALEAEARIVDLSGETWQPVASLFAGPGRSTVDPTRQLITHIRFPRPAAAWGTAWQRAGRRPSLILPTINCAARLILAADGGIAAATIALGPVAATPFRAARAEAFLHAARPAPATWAEAARLAQEEAQPRSNPLRASRAYRSAIIPALVESALATAYGRATEKESPC
ncbi:MAG: Nicotinate dehydrogenase FAD-subunit [Chloroflexi bacterium ADurb.Bin325]|nr:MAG: Nicotinate dehydrogenase FAD-subunit [Chloroflexi bacterium ADurb.Bin325]